MLMVKAMVMITILSKEEGVGVAWRRGLITRVKEEIEERSDTGYGGE